MTRDITLQRRSYWLGVLTIVISILGGLLSGAVLIGSTMKRVDVIETRQGQVEQRVCTVEQTLSWDGRKIDEIAINLKTLMNSQGLKYQTANGGDR